MTMDANGNSHKAAGRPDGGQFDRKAGQGSDDDLEVRPAAMDKVVLQVSAARAIAGREPPDCSKLGPVGANHTLAGWLDREAPGWRYDRAALAASMPGVVDDYRDRDPVDTAEAESIERRALGTPERAGRLVRHLREWLPSDVDSMETARGIIHDRAESARRCYALDPTRCLTPEAFRAAVDQSSVERFFTSKEIRMSAHRMRVGHRYMDRVSEWKAGHKGSTPDGETRDALWDAALADYVAEKKAKGSSFGNGLNYTDGRSAHEGVRPRVYIDRNDMEEPFNGRKDFEGMYRRGQARIRQWAANYADYSMTGEDGDATGDALDMATTTSVTGSALRGVGETERRAYKLALAQGRSATELDAVAKALGLDGDTRGLLEAEWHAEVAFARI